jgi:hypothetical protein
MSNYVGKCVVRLQSGDVVSVHVVDTAGNGMTLDPSDYKARGIKPPLTELPECAKFQTEVKKP